MTIVKIWHNEDRDHFFGYQYGHRLIEVFTYRGVNEGTDLDTDLDQCDAAYHLFNIGDDPIYGEPHPFALAYRLAGHRSLSVGDVVEVNGRFYACASSGWKVLQSDAMREMSKL